jgi:peptide/nickel transport system ATP-binding protein
VTEVSELVTDPLDTTDGGEVLLEVKDLEVCYGQGEDALPAVRDANFTLRRGEIVGVAGESGCGKSTLAFAIARLLRGSGQITKGEILWSGRARGSVSGDPVDLVKADDETLRRIRWVGVSIVMQSAMNAMNPVLSLRSQIGDVIRAHEPGVGRRQREQRVRELLEMVGIPASRVGAFPHELSGGMRQRAVIALALALSPRLVILDEPTTALDVVMQRQVLGELKRLQAELGFAILFITHDLSLLVEVADRILVMYAGTIVEKATALELYRAPLHPYSKGLLTSFPRVSGARTELTGIPGSPPNLRDLPGGCPFHPRCGSAMAECEREIPPLIPRLNPAGARWGEVACLLYKPLADEPTGRPR